jgi:hypothetical protein
MNHSSLHHLLRHHHTLLIIIILPLRSRLAQLTLHHFSLRSAQSSQIVLNFCVQLEYSLTSSSIGRNRYLTIFSRYRYSYLNLP